MEKRAIRIECDSRDQAVLKDYIEAVDTLSELVIEMVGDQPINLLSPLMRKLLVQKAHDVKARHGEIRVRLYVDNPGPSLKGNGS